MIQEELIAALKRKDFEAVTSLANRFGQQTLLDLRAAKTAEARAEIYHNSSAIIRDALSLARVLRAHVASELHANSASFLYRDITSEQHRWRIQA